jgi:hypothetical protein
MRKARKLPHMQGALWVQQQGAQDARAGAPEKIVGQ